MADFTLRPLSPGSRMLLGGLLAVNVAVLVLVLFSDEAPAVTPERKLPADTGPLTLLGELSDTDRRSLEQADQRPAPRATFPEEPPVLECRMWGPFATDEALEPVRAAIAAVTDRLEVVRSEVEAGPDFLIHLATDNNLDNARRLQQELDNQGIEAYVIAGGEFVNAVSAGVFSVRASADRLMQRLEDLGYAPRLETLERSQEVRHLAARVPEGFRLEGQPSAPCRDIAYGEQFL